MTERVVLAYSGGLDTSVAIGWIADATRPRSSPSPSTSARAVRTSTSSASAPWTAARWRPTSPTPVTSSPQEYCLPAIQANALYMDRYPLVSALSRPVIVKHLVAAAKQHGATTVAHGCTGKGNDQVRFEVGIASLAPDLKCIAPVRDLALTRDKAIDYAEKHGLPIETTKKNPYSIDQNVFGPRRRDRLPGGHLERPDRGPLRLHRRTRPVQHDADEVVITFEAGVPVAIDGEKVTVLQAIQKLNQRAGDAGRRPPRHGRGPPRRHQEPRGLRGARRDRAHHRPPGARERHRRARAGPLQAGRRAALGRAGLRRPVVQPAEAGPGHVHRRDAAATSPATSG